MKRTVLHWLWLVRREYRAIRAELAKLWAASAALTDEELENWAAYDPLTRDRR